MRGLSRRARAAIAAGLVLLVATCGAGWYGIRALQASRTPTTISLNVRDGAREVPLGQVLVLKTSRALALDVLRGGFRLNPAVEGTLASSKDQRTFTWTPSQPLADLTAYTVEVRPATDAGGHAVQRGRWRFTTTLVPRVVALATAAGTVVADGSEIPLGMALQLRFNNAIDPASVNLLANGGLLNLGWAADHRSARIDPGSLQAGPLQLALTPGARDAQGRAVSEWKLSASLVFHVDIHTVPLTLPALVQIPNDPAARDQSGLQAASIVFESVAEGGITRFTALFKNAPDVIGPVRSGRLISFKLTRHYHGMLFASGLSEGSTGRLNENPVPHLFDIGPGWYYHSGARYPPNNLYIRSDVVQRAQASQPGFKLVSGPVVLDGEAAAQASVPDHHSTYDFDPATATYVKTEEGHLMADAALGQPLHIQMLVVLHTQVTVTGIIEDSNFAHGLDYALDSSGKAEFYYQGKRATGSWSSIDRFSPLTFKLDSGAQLALPSGLVWIDVVG